MSRALMVTYDLNAPGKDYKRVHDAIKGLGPWWHYLDSTWIAVTPLSPSQAWDVLAKSFDETDSCLVVDITGDSFSGWLPREAWDWLNKHIYQPAR